MKFRIERLDKDDWRLLVDDRQQGLYKAVAGAKAGARRFVPSHSRIQWKSVGGCGLAWLGMVVSK